MGQVHLPIEQGQNSEIIFFVLGNLKNRKKTNNNFRSDFEGEGFDLPPGDPGVEKVFLMFKIVEHGYHIHVYVCNFL